MCISRTAVLHPASRHLLSEVAILSRMARRTLRRAGIPWDPFEGDYGLSATASPASCRDSTISTVGSHDQAGSSCPTPSTSAGSPPRRAKPCSPSTSLRSSQAPHGYLLLQSLRSHDQWNTIPYTPDDRYRGIHGSRQVVIVNPADLAFSVLPMARRSTW